MPISVEDCLVRIARLPQVAWIGEERALHWIKRTLAVDPERIGWHIARAGGIGGSEAGAMLSWQYGDVASRGSAERLARNKLLLLPPDRSNDDTGRGAFLEDHICTVYEHGLDRDGRMWKRRDDIKAAIEAAPHPRYPWLRASVDRVYPLVS